MAEPIKDWFLKEWMTHQGRIQAEIARELGWERGRVSKVVNGRQPYQRSDVLALSKWLGIEPFELLMSPKEAMALRRIRESAAMIVAEDPANFEIEPNVAAHGKIAGRAR